MYFRSSKYCSYFTFFTVRGTNFKANRYITVLSGRFPQGHEPRHLLLQKISYYSSLTFLFLAHAVEYEYSQALPIYINYLKNLGRLCV